MLKRLETAGLVFRRQDEEDRRTFLLELSPEGAFLAEQVHHRLEAFESEVVMRTSEEEVEAFRAVMEAIGEVTDGRNSREP